jgi:predicted anti-sigma-YlaC factor YlaD
MKCEIAREALSARIDGEPEPLPVETVDRHVAGCAACDDWYRRAGGLRRALILQPAPVVPDLTAAIMAQLPDPRPAHLTLRIALAVVAIAQTATALSELFGADIGMGNDHGAFMMGHMSHESAAWNVAIGIGLMWAVLRPRAAAGQLPMLTVFVGVLAAASLLDLADGQVTASRLLTHVPVVAGVALLYAVHRVHRDDDQQHPERLPAPREDPVSDCVDGARPPGLTRPGSRTAWAVRQSASLRDRRPAGRHAA